ncbi:hypothetical protein ACLB9Y_02745 [Chryseobacterium scophthalmum]|uniref:hypothetical protein n=1 Tax=Chryseobacterium scophthalmum TaxID=59733 RepID=UPI00398AA2DB
MTFFNHKKSKDIIVVIVIQKFEITSSTQCLILANFIFKEQKKIKNTRFIQALSATLSPFFAP